MKKFIGTGIITLKKDIIAGSHYACQIEIGNLSPKIEGHNKIGFYKTYKPNIKKSNKVNMFEITGFWDSLFKCKYQFEKIKKNKND